MVGRSVWTKVGKGITFIFMTETKGGEVFTSKFHRRYVGGVGEVVEKPLSPPLQTIKACSYEEVLAEYRWYMRDPQAELPEELMETLKVSGKL